ncbi:MAG: sulfite exporter TauE/SafE family protein [Bacteroidia bacterium]
MESTEILGLFLSCIMGITLGLFGGGGSMLTVPILVYVFNISPVLATAYSLFVVGSVALTGSIHKIKKGEVNLKIAAYFALPSIVSVYLTRRLIIPAIPDEIVQIGSRVLHKDLALMLFFALIMLLASFSMIRGRKDKEVKKKEVNWTLVILDGLFVGVITGLVGAGGGFLIVPALVLLVGLPIRQAIATSLLIISLKSLLGFIGDINAGLEIDWRFLAIFTAFAIGGMFIGFLFSKNVKAEALKKGFGWFVLAMAIGIILIEIT